MQLDESGMVQAREPASGEGMRGFAQPRQAHHLAPAVLSLALRLYLLAERHERRRRRALLAAQPDDCAVVGARDTHAVVACARRGARGQESRGSDMCSDLAQPVFQRRPNMSTRLTL